MVRQTKRYNVKHGGTRTTRSTLRTDAQRRFPTIYKCMNKFEDKISHLLMAYIKYLYIFRAVGQGISDEWDGSLTIKNWDNVLAKNNNFRKPQENEINPKILIEPLDVTDEDGMRRVGGNGWIDLAQIETRDFTVRVADDLKKIKEINNPNRELRETEIKEKFKELSQFMMETIAGCIGMDLRNDGMGWRSVMENNERIVLFKDNTDEEVLDNLPDVMQSKMLWTEEDYNNILAGWQPSDTRQNQIYMLCKTRSARGIFAERKMLLLNAIEKLTNIYHLTYIHLIPYLPANLFKKNIGYVVPAYDTKLQDPDILDLIVAFNIQPTDGVEIIADLWKKEEGEVLLQQMRDRIIERIYRPADMLDDVPGKGFNLHSAYTEGEILLINEILIGEGKDPIERTEYAQYIVDREFYHLIDGIKEELMKIYEIDNNASRQDAYSKLIKDVNETIAEIPELDVIRYASEVPNPIPLFDGSPNMTTGLAEMITTVLDEIHRSEIYLPEDEGVVVDDEVEDDESKEEEGIMEDWAAAASALNLRPHVNFYASIALQHSALSDMLDPLDQGQGHAVLIPGTGIVDVPGTKLSWSTAEELDWEYKDWLQLRLNESYFNLLDRRVKEEDPHLRTARWHSAVLFNKYLPYNRDIIEYAPMRGILIDLFNQSLDGDGAGYRRRYTRHKKHKHRRKCKGKKTRRKKKRKTRRKKKKRK